MQKYIGQIVAIIYMDRGGRFTKRRVKLLAVDGDRVKVYCLERQAPRMLLTASVLAVEPVRRKPKYVV